MRLTFIRWTCEAPSWAHVAPNGLHDDISSGGDCSTYREALKKARKHFKDTGHLCRAEKCFTELIGWGKD